MVKKKKQLKRKVTKRKLLNRGEVQLPFIVAILLLLAFLGLGLLIPKGKSIPGIGGPTPTLDSSKKNLQLYTFTPPPTPTSAQPPAQPAHCSEDNVNDEPEILVGFDPGPNKVVGPSNQIRVWVTDEGGPKVSLGEKIDANGNVTTRGNTAIKDSCISGQYSWEPSLYIYSTTQTIGPFYPGIIKGDYTPSSDCSIGDNPLGGPKIDPDYTSFLNGPNRDHNLLDYTAEFIWNVPSFGLQPGTYNAQFVIHDGDRNVGVGCATVQL